MPLPAAGLASVASAASPYVPKATAYVQKYAGKAYKAASDYVTKSTGQSISAIAQQAVTKPSSALTVLDGMVRGGVPKNVLAAAFGEALSSDEIAKLYAHLKGIDDVVESKINNEATIVTGDPTQLAYYASLRSQVFGMLPQLKGKVDNPSSVFHGMRRVEVLRKYLEMVCDANEDAVESFDRVRYGA